MNELGENLVFLICAPRTGSTLLQQMLASHTEVHTLAAPSLMLPLIYGLRKDNGLKPIGIETEYDALTTNQNIHAFLNKLPEKTGLYYEAVRKMALHIYASALEGTRKRYFLDKSVRYYLIVPELMQTFPKAKFIVLCRNPISQFASVVKAWVSDGEWKNFRARYNDIVRSHFFLRDAIRDFEGRVAAVRYEELVAQPETTLKRLCAYLELTYEEPMVNYGTRIKKMTGVDIVGMGDIKSLRKHERPVTHYVDNWARHIDTPQKAYVARSCMATWGEDLFAQLGYSYGDAMDVLARMTVPSEEVHYTWEIVSEPELSDEVRRKQEDLDEMRNPQPPRVVPQLNPAATKTVHSPIVGAWLCKYGFLKDTFFVFEADGTFKRHSYIKFVNITMGGRYNVDESVSPAVIDLDVTTHSTDESNLGTWRGIFEVTEHVLKLRYNPPGNPRWTDPDGFNHLFKVESEGQVKPADTKIRAVEGIDA